MTPVEGVNASLMVVSLETSFRLLVTAGNLYCKKLTSSTKGSVASDTTTPLYLRWILSAPITGCKWFYCYFLCLLWMRSCVTVWVGRVVASLGFVNFPITFQKELILSTTTQDLCMFCSAMHGLDYINAKSAFKSFLKVCLHLKSTWNIHVDLAVWGH